MSPEAVQLSEAESNTSLNTTVTEPFASKSKVTVPATVVIDGSSSSVTVTVIDSVTVLFEPSVTV